METVQQNGRFTLFSSKYHSNIYSILYGFYIKGALWFLLLLKNRIITLYIEKGDMQVHWQRPREVFLPILTISFISSCLNKKIYQRRLHN